MQLSEAILLQVIATSGVVLVALITVGLPILVALSNRTRQHAKAASSNSAEARDQVANDHDENLRDDLDSKFAGLDLQLAAIAKTQSRHGRQINRLFANDHRLEEEIEHTRQPKKRTYTPKEKTSE